MTNLSLIQMILCALAVFFAGYFVGCINFAIIISKIKNKGQGDIRSIGSGNPGMLNMSRAYGIKIGVLILTLDILKGLVPCLVARLIFKNFAYNKMCLEQTALFITGLGAVCGHIFPFWLKFKGGKGISTTIGVFAACQFGTAWLFGFCAIAFILITRMGSMGSFIATTPQAILCSYLYYKDYAEYLSGDIYFKVLFAITNACIILIIAITWWAHRKNIQRLLVGEEHPTNWLQMIKDIKFKSKIKKQK